MDWGALDEKGRADSGRPHVAQIAPETDRIKGVLSERRQRLEEGLGSGLTGLL